MNTDPLARQFEALQKRADTYDTSGMHMPDKDHPETWSARRRLLSGILALLGLVEDKEIYKNKNADSFLAIGESMFRILDMKNEDAAEMSLEIYRDRVTSLLESKT